MPKIQRTILERDVQYTTLCGYEPPMGVASYFAGVEWIARMKLGPQATLWRRHRDGTESEERGPLYLLELTLAAIPECEPHIERARLVR